MIHFLAPWAAAGAILLAGPLLVHMLLRRNARRLIFPAMRFLVETRAAAVRFRRPSDIALLIVRLGIVGSAILAAAHPLLLTARRLAQWDARIVRAVVVDSSPSAAQSGVADRLADQELNGAFRVQRFASADLRDGLTRAAAWLADAPAGRREVVIVSDFQRGSIDRQDLSVLPAYAGVRTIRASTGTGSGGVRTQRVIGFRGARWQPSVRLEAGSTVVTWSRSGDAGDVPWLTTSQAPPDADAAARALYAAVSAGVPSGDDSRRVRVRFAGAPADTGGGQAVRTPWMVDAILALGSSALLRETNAAVTTTEQDGVLVVDTTAAAASLDAPAVIRAVVLAVRPASIADREAEVVTLPDAELAAWRRDPAPVASTPNAPASIDSSDSDARWFWVLALALVAVESWLRRRSTASQPQQVRDAA